jgi:hypothetical protein
MHDMSLRDGDEDGFCNTWRMKMRSCDTCEWGPWNDNEDGKAGFVGKQGWVGGVWKCNITLEFGCHAFLM